MGWAAAAQVAGELLDSGLSIYNARQAWLRQKEAMQNAHQWEVADLRKAGLNPILSATGGSGASTGGLNSPMPTSNFSGGIGNAFQAMKLGNELDQQKASIELTRQQTATARAQADYAYSNARLLNEQAGFQQMRNSYLLKNPMVLEQMVNREALPAYGGLVSGGLTLLNAAKQALQK